MGSILLRRVVAYSRTEPEKLIFLSERTKASIGYSHLHLHFVFELHLSFIQSDGHGGIDVLNFVYWWVGSQKSPNLPKGTQGYK